MAQAWMSLLDPLAGDKAIAARLANRGARLQNQRFSDLLGAEQEQRAANKSIGALLAGGDRPGAARTAYETGQIDAGSKIQERIAADKKAAGEELGTLSGQILSLPDDQQGPAFMAAMPQFREAARRAGIDFNPDATFDENDRVTMRALAAHFGKLPGAGKGEPLEKTFDPATKQITYTPRSQAAGMQAPPPSSAATINTPQYGKIGQDEYGNPLYGFVDKAKRTVTPVQPQGQSDTPFLDVASGASVVPEDAGPGWRDEDFLSSLPTKLADEVRALSEGRMKPPTGRAASSPHFLKVLEATRRYDPSFDYNDYRSRYRTRADFSAGVAARNITAHNTALKHIAGMTSAIDALENTRFPVWNWMANWSGQQFGDSDVQKAVSRFNTVKKAVADEMAKVFAGSQSALADREAWEEKFSSADSPAALKAAVAESLELLHARLVALADQYNRGMGSARDPIDLLAPDAKKALKKAEEWIGGGGGEVSAPVTTGKIKIRRLD